MINYYNTRLIDIVFDDTCSEEERNEFICKLRDDDFNLHYRIQKEINVFFEDYERIDFIKKIRKSERKYFSRMKKKAQLSFFLYRKVA